jgi:hypothetical protein
MRDFELKNLSPNAAASSVVGAFADLKPVSSFGGAGRRSLTPPAAGGAALAATLEAGTSESLAAAGAAPAAHSDSWDRVEHLVEISESSEVVPHFFQILSIV